MDNRTDKELELIRRTIDNPQFHDPLESLLMDILSVDTSPEQPLEELSRSEDLVFHKISEYLDSLRTTKVPDPGTRLPTISRNIVSIRKSSRFRIVGKPLRT